MPASMEMIMNRLPLLSARMFSQIPGRVLGLMGLEESYVGLLVHDTFGDPRADVKKLIGPMRDMLVKAYTLIPRQGMDIEDKTAEELVKAIDDGVAEFIKGVTVRI